ncbi:MAG: hypothetical protein OEZ02_12295 [Anaerolineae bacterium]|nr:hypothetical protein [Anaerolineae bacterium]
MTAKNIMVQPTKPRHTLEDTGEGLRVVIPSRKRWYLIILQIVTLVVGIMFWFWIVDLTLMIGFGFSPRFVNVYSSVAPISSGVLLGIFLALIALALQCGFMAYAILWQIVGQEIIEVNPKSLVSLRRVYSFGRSNEYLAQDIKGMRVSPFMPRLIDWKGSFYELGLTGGLIAFDYGARTIRIGGGIDEAEAKQILAAIVARYPQYAAEGAG